MTNDIIYREAKKRLSYCKEDGKFRWLSTTQWTKKGRVAGGVNGRGYRLIQIDGVSLLAHRLAWYFVHGVVPEMIDHINGNVDDNRLANLRQTNHHRNGYNRKVGANNTSGVIGVRWCGNRGKWKSSISYDGRAHHLGSFDEMADAVRARRDAEKQHHGEYSGSRCRCAN